MTFVHDPGGGLQIVVLISSQGSFGRDQKLEADSREEKATWFLEGKMIVLEA